MSYLFLLRFSSILVFFLISISKYLDSALAALNKDFVGFVKNLDNQFVENKISGRVLLATYNKDPINSRIGKFSSISSSSL
ncbi:hypothetical protein HUG17_9772 [Dermatophagoides farinae]|uniref:Uncharacterized protein n=1 Tax=Dermatophagoides farinae TaxID=6954 RepID=A0A9D4P2Q7_DERFA|nr:hypothetical protein HUG17_9772 [Dermatophagoides farinae]